LPAAHSREPEESGPPSPQPAAPYAADSDLAHALAAWRDTLRVAQPALVAAWAIAIAERSGGPGALLGRTRLLDTLIDQLTAALVAPVFDPRPFSGIGLLLSELDLGEPLVLQESLSALSQALNATLPDPAPRALAGRLAEALLLIAQGLDKAEQRASEARQNQHARAVRLSQQHADAERERHAAWQGVVAAHAGLGVVELSLGGAIAAVAGNVDSLLGLNPAWSIGQPLLSLLPAGVLSPAQLQQAQAGVAQRWLARVGAQPLELALVPLNEQCVLPNLLLLARPAPALADGAMMERTDEAAALTTELAPETLLARLAREVRTPLQVLLGQVELLVMAGGKQMYAEQAARLEQIEHSSQLLLQMADDVQGLMLLRAGMLHLERARVGLGGVAQMSVERLAGRAAAQGVTLLLELDLGADEVEADVERLNQIVLHLLTSALTHTTAGGQVGVRLRGEQTQGWVTMMVWTTGDGIAQSEQARLFQPFVRLGRGGREELEGTGLELALVAQLVRAHRGTITVKSAPGAGIQFHIRLPVSPRGSGRRSNDLVG
jgi:NtrC-family two-component system sensor histidine kinase KinB